MNETPENQSTPPAADGQHGFGAFTSSEQPAPPEAPAAGTAGEEPVTAAPAAPQPAAETPASAVPAPDGAIPAAPAAAPAASAQPYQAAPQQPVDPASPQQPVDPAAQQYSGTQPYPAPQYRAAPQYPGAAPAAGYDPNAQAYDPNAPAGVPPYGGGYPLPAPAPKKGLSRGALFGIIGGAAALVLIIAAAIIVPALLRGPSLTASDVVEDYLTALSEGDAETALEYVDPYDYDELLTAEVLQASLELGAIDDIEVGEETEGASGSSAVPVTFTVGGESVSREFEVYEYSDEWQIIDGLVLISTLSGFDGLGLTINGAEAPETAYVFPGTYELALATDAFTFSGGTSVFRIATDDDTEALWDVRPELSESGVETFRSLVSASLEECLAMKTLSTPCGMDVTGIDLSGATPVEDSVTRTLTTEGESALASLEPQVSSGTVVSSYDSIDVDITLQGEQDGQRNEYEVWWGAYVGTPTVDFGAEEPTVVWE